MHEPTLVALAAHRWRDVCDGLPDLTPSASRRQWIVEFRDRAPAPTTAKLCGNGAAASNA